MSSQYHQFESSKDYHHFLIEEFPLRQLQIDENSRTSTCWFDSFLFFISRPIHGDFFRRWMQTMFNLNNTSCGELDKGLQKYYRMLFDYLQNIKIGIGDLPTLTNDQKVELRRFAVCQLVGPTNINHVWTNGHGLYEPFRIAMSDWSDQTIWFTPDSYVKFPCPCATNWGWPLLPTPETEGDLQLNSEYLTAIQLNVPSTEYIAINIQREGVGTLIPEDLTFGCGYELVTLFPWNADHVTCINKTIDEKWEAYDNENDGKYYIEDDLEKIYERESFNIRKTSVFVVYKKKC